MYLLRLIIHGPASRIYWYRFKRFMKQWLYNACIRKFRNPAQIGLITEKKCHTTYQRTHQDDMPDRKLLPYFNTFLSILNFKVLVCVFQSNSIKWWFAGTIMISSKTGAEETPCQLAAVVLTSSLNVYLSS